MIEAIHVDERYVLNPALFIRKNGDGGVIYARRAQRAFTTLCYPVTVSEINLLRYLSGGATLADSLRLCHCSSSDDSHALQKFAGWAFQYSILLNKNHDEAAFEAQFDPLLELGADGSEGAFAKQHGARMEAPIYLTFVPTFKCQSACIYCFLGPKERGGKKITIPRLKQIMDECRDLHIFQWRLAGGEVLLYPDLLVVLRELFSRGIFLGRPITTKIPVEMNMLRKLRDVGVDEMQYSLDTVNPKVLDSLVRGKIQGGMEYIRAMINSIKEACRLHFRVIIRPTITSRNYQHIPELVKAVASMLDTRIEFSVVTTDGTGTAQGLGLGKTDWFRTRETFARMREIYPGVAMCIKMDPYAEAYGSEENVNDVHHPTTRSFVKAASCPGNRTMLFMLPDGRATICNMPSVRDDVTLGHLTRQSIADVWSSPLSKELAYPIREKCEGSPCIDCEEFTRCHLNAGKCLALVAKAHGVGNLHFPDPRCPRSPGRPLSVNHVKFLSVFGSENVRKFLRRGTLEARPY